MLCLSRLILICFSLLLSAGCGGGGDSTPAAGQQAGGATSATISGSFSAATGSFIDSDVNDPLAPYSPNDTTPQDIGNPFITGGFASAVATGVVEDRFKNIPDQVDLYSVDLTGGQTVTLIISGHQSADPGANDLDLYLIDPAEPGNNRSSLSAAAVETVTVPADGSYEIKVEAVSGKSNYVLSVGAAVSVAPAPSFRLEDDFVPGEVIVRFKETGQPAGADRSVQAQADSIGLQVKAGEGDRPLLVSLGDSQQRRAALAKLLPLSNRRPSLQNEPDGSDASLKRDTLLIVKALHNRADIQYAEPNYILQPSAITPDDQYYGLQWHYPLINLPQAWEVAPDSSAVVVAIIDTGIFMDHVDLAANLLDDGYDFISDPNSSLDGDGIDPDPDDPGDNPAPSPSSFHGTHVAGTVSAITDNHIGVAGISWGAAGMSKILPVRVLGLGGGTSYDIIQGVRYAAGLSNDADTIPARIADIINMSFGGDGYSQLMRDTFTEIRNQGILCIAAAGNENSASPRYPAAYDGVISVSAVNLNKQRAWYSNFGPTIDVAAPGGDMSADTNGDGYPDGVLSTLADNRSGVRESVYAFSAGTSMAAPHVAGITALMKAIYPGLTPNDFNVLLASALITEDLGASGRDDLFGYGLIDALKATQEASNLAHGASLPPLAVINPASLHFGTTQPVLTFTISNGGGGSFSVTSVTETASWLQVTPTDVDANNLGTYTAVVDRTGLTGAIYATTITVDTDVPESLDIPVSMQVSTPGSAENDAGFHYVLIIDPKTGNTIRTLTAASSSGSYSFSFENVATGSYFIVAGTDSDNDGFICDAGEACGGYPTLDQLAAVEVNGNNVNGLSFISGFNFNLSSAAASTAIPPPGFARLPVGNER